MNFQFLSQFRNHCAKFFVFTCFMLLRLNTLLFRNLLWVFCWEESNYWVLVFHKFQVPLSDFVPSVCRNLNELKSKIIPPSAQIPGIYNSPFRQSPDPMELLLRKSKPLAHRKQQVKSPFAYELYDWPTCKKPPAFVTELPLLPPDRQKPQVTFSSHSEAAFAHIFYHRLSHNILSWITRSENPFCGLF